MKLIYKEKKQILIIASGIFMIAGFVMFRYLPLRSRIAEYRSQARLSESVVASALTDTQMLDDNEEKLAKIIKQVGNFDKSIPRDSGLGSLLHQLAQLMDECSLTDQRIEPKTQVLKDDLGHIGLTMQCRGTTENIFEFFKNLRRMERAVKIEDVTLSSDGYDGAAQMTTKAAVFYRSSES